MKTILAMLLVAATIVGCTPTEKGATIGAASGAVIGTAVGGDIGGALAGAAIGGIAGAVIGKASEGSNQCYYRDRYGRRYTARCPSGY